MSYKILERKLVPHVRCKECGYRTDNQEEYYQLRYGASFVSYKEAENLIGSLEDQDLVDKRKYLIYRDG